MTGSELLIIVIFLVFISWVLIKPEGILSIQKRIYHLIGIEVNYSDRAKFFVRMAALLALTIGIFGLYNTLRS